MDLARRLFFFFFLIVLCRELVYKSLWTRWKYRNGSSAGGNQRDSTRLRYISRKLGMWFLGVLKVTAMFVTATGHAEPSWERLLELEEMVLVSHGALPWGKAAISTSSQPGDEAGSLRSPGLPPLYLMQDVVRVFLGNNCIKKHK